MLSVPRREELMENTQRVDSFRQDVESTQQRTSRPVPPDWFVDPADPDALGQIGPDDLTLEGQATELLKAHSEAEAAAEAVASASAESADSAERTDVASTSGSSPRATVTQLYPQSTPEEDPAPEKDAQAPSRKNKETPEAQPVALGLPGFLAPDDEGELAWQADALCAQTDPEAFFPEKGGSTRDAKKVCSACTVRSECLEYALKNDERFGIWGGMSERERRRLRKKSS